MQVPYLTNFLSSLKSAKLDDIVDRAHYLFTTALLTFFALLIGSKQTFGEPIRCIVPAQYTSSWNDYVHQYCYVTSTFHTNNGTDFDPNLPKIDVSYYQWIPYFLALQALLFYAPHMLWMSLQKTSEIDFVNLVERCEKLREKPLSGRKDDLKDIAEYLRQVSRLRRWGTGPSSLGWMATLCYLMTKVINVANIFVQIHFMNQFVGVGKEDWVWQILEHGVNGHFWERTGFFPRVTFCEYSMKKLGSVQPSTTQCILMINMINEKAFVILYLWMLLLLVPTILNLIYTTFVFCFSCLRTWQGRRYLRQVFNKQNIYVNFNDTMLYKEMCTVSSFVNEWLGLDGLLLLRFIHSRAGFLVASELTTISFYMYVEEEPAKEAESIMESTPLKVEIGSKKHKNKLYATEMEPLRSIESTA